MATKKQRWRHCLTVVPPRLPIHTAEIPIRCYRAVEKCYRGRMTLGQFWFSVRVTFIAVKKPYGHVGNGD